MSISGRTEVNINVVANNVPAGFDLMGIDQELAAGETGISVATFMKKTQA